MRVLGVCVCVCAFAGVPCTLSVVCLLVADSANTVMAITEWVQTKVVFLPSGVLATTAVTRASALTDTACHRVCVCTYTNACRYVYSHPCQRDQNIP